MAPVERIENRLDNDVMAADWKALTAPRPALQLGSRTIRLDQPQLMAILNATPDSFSDGGKFLDKPDAAMDEARLDAFVAHHYPRLQRRRGRGQTLHGEAYRQAVADGRELTLRRPVDGAAPPRLLTK